MKNVRKNNLSRQEFEILTNALYANSSDSQTSEDLAALEQKGLMKDGRVTAKGRRALKPYRVRRAVIIAAGFGSRLVPITLNTPKPLVRVHGTRIIDTSLDAIFAAGIKEVYIVRGYLKEQFDQLKYKYPKIKFIDNDLYNEANNISSALKAKKLLKNAYVLEADLLLRNPKVVRRYEYTSNFLGFPVDASDDWCFTVKDGLIRNQVVGASKERDGTDGVDVFQEVGISYWNAADGEKLREHVSLAFEQPNGKQLYWDQIMFKVFPNEYSVEIRQCDRSDVLEIDTFQELQREDEQYKA